MDMAHLFKECRTFSVNRQAPARVLSATTYAGLQKHGKFFRLDFFEL